MEKSNLEKTQQEKTSILYANNILPLVLSILIAQTAGIIGSFFTVSSVGSWYKTLAKPSWNPPSWVFGPVWITLYTLMGLAAFFIWKNRKHPYAKKALLFYGIQLVLNAWWSILFFGLKNPGIALIDIIILLVMMIITTLYFWKVERKAAWMMLPYIAWVGFATVLNFTLWQMN